ncbi:SusC/RagA family TonB-linked outer membrane protein [Flavobacterium sp.]|uniref:SusC/RagA family TonB-linked outer membrane protein n=1 Tax=Flavobacterium sp. TaxID=239 RepID=UPI00286E676E|nr:SusC/RagA family TonB-linked outer membrane protein [Flavobacterium sp.]
MRSKFKWIFTLLVALTMQFSFAQEKTITGTVSDGSGPIPGANVVVKGTQRGVSTGFDGKYSIKAKEGEVLVFSFMGMRDASATIGASSVVNAKLKDDAEQLVDVVVTAFGIKKKDKAVSSATQQIKGSALTEARESNLVNALSGKIAGVQVTSSSGGVGASSRIVLRGNSSITGNNEALFVVDGIPFDNSSATSGKIGIAGANTAGSGGGVDTPNGIASINPDDIESITVLKGPTAAALYGIRAAQGVILITTKKGKSGEALGVSINSNITFANPLITPDFQNSYGQSGRPSDNFFQFTDGSAGTTPDGTDESWGLPLDVGYSFVQWDSFKVGGAPLPWISHPDNVRDFYDTGISISNTVALSGGSEKADFRFSFGNTDEKGIVPFTDFKKFNVSANGNLKLGNSVTGGVAVNYFKDASGNLPVGGYTGENPVQQTIFSARNIDFQALKDWRNLPIITTGAGGGSPLNWNTQYQNNPYWVLENNTTTYARDRVVGKFNLGYKITPSLTLTGNVAMDSHSTLLEARQAFGSANNKFAAGTAPNGSFETTASRYNETNADFLVNYNTKLTEDIGFSINGGGNAMKRVSTYTYGRADALEVPGLYNLSNLKSGSTLRASNRYVESRINSLYGFGQFSYKTYFYLDFTGRNDWASVLPSNNNSFFYPSLTGSLVISDILNTKTIGIDLIKLRGGWSKVGSTGALNPYNLNDTFLLTPGAYGNLGSVPGTEFSNKLKPETTIGVEYGLDLNAFANRFRLGFTYYDQKSTDLLLPVGVADSSGFTQSWQNIGEMQNKGFDVAIGGTLLKSENFSFDVDLNFAKNDNKVVSIGDLPTLILGGQWGVTLEAIAGESYGSIVGNDYQRDPAGNVVHENGLPVLNTKKSILGNITPDWTGGANFAVKYKNIDFTALVDAKVGGDVHSVTHAFGRYAGVLEETLIGREGGLIGQGVMSDGAGGFVPNNVVVSAKDYNYTAYSASSASAGSVFDATYVKLRQMTIGYSLPKKFLKNTSIDGLKLSIVARNLAMLYRKAPHIDPESAFSSANGEQGQEFGQIPTTRTIGFNVNVKF